jgi:hypothetical protein
MSCPYVIGVNRRLKMDIKLLLDIDEDQLDEAGYAVHHQVSDLWPSYAKSNVSLEPNTGLAMLEPVFAVRKPVLEEWEPGNITSHLEYDNSYLGLLRLGPHGSWGDGIARTRYTLPEGEGRCFLFRLNTPWPTLNWYIEVFFGGRYRLRFWNYAETTLYRSTTTTWESGFDEYKVDMRTGEAWNWLPVATGNLISNDADYNRIFYLYILPLPGGVKVWTPLGEIFFRESDLNGNGQAMLPAPLQLHLVGGVLDWLDSPLTFPPSGTFSSPVQALPYSSSQSPSLSYLAPPSPADGTSISVALTKGDGSPPEPPLEDYQYTTTLSTTAPTHTPFYRATKIDFASTQRAINGASVPVDTFIREIAERCSLDQPLRSLSFTANNESGIFDSYKSRANLPVQLNVGDQPRFTGVTNLPTAEEGHIEWITLECYDGWRRLQNALLSNAQTFDGLAHTEVVRDICHRAGLPDSRLEIASDDYALPSSQDDEPLYRPTNGQSAASFLEHIRDSFSGWRMGFNAEGKFFYQPPSTDIEPTAFFHRTTAEANDFGGPSARHYALRSLAQKVDQSQHRNEIWVVGQDQETEEPLAAVFLDFSSLYDPTYAYYVGERRLLIWLDPGLNTQEAVNWVCRTLAEKYARFRVYQTFEAQFDETLTPDAPVEVDGQLARIISMSSRFSTKEQRTRYEVRLET